MLEAYPVMVQVGNLESPLVSYLAPDAKAGPWKWLGPPVKLRFG
jgi:hypothetical protein